MFSKTASQVLIPLLLASTLTLALRIQPVNCEELTDFVGDWFNSMVEPIVGSNITDIVTASIAQSGQEIQVNMTVDENLPEQLPADINEIDYVFAFDTDQNQSTGMPPSQLVRNDLGVDYFVGVYYSALGWMGRLFNATEGTYINITTFEHHESVISVNILLRNIGYPSSFYWMAFTRETNRTANYPDWEIMDKAPNQGHHSFEILGTIHNINTGLNYTSIQEAINYANIGDTIHVDSGIYYENIVINKTISLIGEDRRTTIIDGDYTADVVLIVADNVTLSGFTIRNSQRSWAKRGVGLNGVKNCNLTENIIENNIFGIHLYSSYNNFLRNNNITNNEFNFVIDFSSLPVYVEQLINDIDSSNIIDGAPIYFWINKHNIEVPLDAGYVALINCTRVTARNLKLTKNGGFYVFFTSNSLISNNTFIGNIWGLLLLNSTDNEITMNNVTQNAASIGLVMSSNNTITQNNISYNGGSYAHTPGMYFESYITLLYSHNNTLSENNITSNTGGVYLDHANNNKLFHNNFLNNFVQVKCVDSNSVWDNDYPSGGNYWGDYTGVDVNNDCLGDTPYVIDENNTDRHPLMAPFRTFNVGAWNGTSYNVGMVTNSTVSSFQVDTDKKRISFNVSGVEGTIGFCRVAIPNIIAQDLWQGNYTVLLDGSPWPFINWTDNINTYILINYTHSEHDVVIIPEFPSTLTLAIFTLTTSIATTLWKTKRKCQPP